MSVGAQTGEKVIRHEKYDAKVKVFYDAHVNLWQCFMVVTRTQEYEGGNEAFVVKYIPRHGEHPYFSVQVPDSGTAAFPVVVDDGGVFRHALFHNPGDGAGEGPRTYTRTNEVVLPPVKASDSLEANSQNISVLTRAYLPEGGVKLSPGSTLVLLAEFPVWFPLYPAEYEGFEVYAAAFYHSKTPEAGGKVGVLDEELTRKIRSVSKYYKRYTEFQRLELVVVDPKPGRVYGLVWRRPAFYELEQAYPGKSDEGDREDENHKDRNH